ncbi:MAG: glucose-6-phosphate isomerase [Alphaproteobacteria bacterium]|nr:glucose-6-phosphate isomerase [Alphaproteobacteria bacterium]
MSFRLTITDGPIVRLGDVRSSAGAFRLLLGEAQTALTDLIRSSGGSAFLGLAERTDDLGALERLAGALRGRFKRLYVLGTGGSSLGGQAIAGALVPSGQHGDGDRRLVFLDNIDPVGFDAALEGIALREAVFLSISKSGATAETLAQTLIVFERLSRTVDAARIGEHFIFVVEPGDSPLRRLAGRLGAVVLDHDPNLGGRFSALSLVGLLPALYLGLDARAMRAGAASMLADAGRSNEHQPAAVAEAAALSVTALNAGLHGSVLMTYGDALQPLARWWQQLVAESLGKDGRGLTPIVARGSTDQHSVLQLYLAGPADKFFTILGPAPAPAGTVIEPSLAEAIGIPYLGGTTLDRLFTAEADATAAALKEAGRSVRRVALTRLDAPTLGGLLMHFMVETVLIAKLIGVNPFDQPAVERGKVLVRQILEGRTP